MPPWPDAYGILVLALLCHCKHLLGRLIHHQLCELIHIELRILHGLDKCIKQGLGCSTR